MREIIHNAFQSVFTDKHNEVFSKAVGFRHSEMFEKIALKKLLSLISAHNSTFIDVAQSPELMNLANSIASGEADLFFDAQYLEFASQVTDMLTEAAQSLGVVLTDSPCITDLYPLAAGGLKDCPLYELGALNHDLNIDGTLVVLNTAHRFNDFIEATSFMANKPNSVVLARIAQLNETNTDKESSKPFILINNGHKLLALNLAASPSYSLNGLIKIEEKEGYERPIDGNDILAILMCVVINQTRYLELDRAPEKLIFSSTTSTRTLPSVLKAPTMELEDIAVDDLLYSKISPNYGWLDKHIDTGILKEIINLEQERAESGEIFTYFFESSTFSRGEVKIQRLTGYDSFKHNSHRLLLAHNPNAVGTKAQLLNSKLEVARFNKAVLASITLDNLWLKSKGIGTELRELLKSTSTKSVFDALTPLLKSEINGKLKSYFGNGRDELYKPNVISFNYRGKGLRGVLESAGHPSSSLGYGSWNQDKLPLTLITGVKVNANSKVAIKEARCAYSGKPATHILGINLSRHDILEALIASGATDGYHLDANSEIATKLSVMKYMPTFKSQRFGDHSISSKTSYPKDRECIEDYIHNKFFSECTLLIPLSNAAIKFLESED